jgi:hypothetical protein
MSQAELLFKTDKIEIECEQVAGKVVVRLMGIIDEDVNFSVLLRFAQELPKKKVRLVLDLDGVSRINSCGVREWLLFIERLAAIIEFQFDNVCELFIEQSSMMPKVLGTAKTLVISFKAPFWCKHCQENRVVLMTPDEVKFTEDGSAQVTAAKCEHCKNPMEFDSLVDEYFDFLRAA